MLSRNSLSIRFAGVLIAVLILLVLLHASVMARETHALITAADQQTSLYFAEGYTGGDFDTYILIQNTSNKSANVQLHFQLPAGAKRDPLSLQVARDTRLTVRLNDIPGLEGTDVSTLVTSEQPVVAERAMYFDYYGKSGGHDSIGVNCPSTAWFFAEGYTGGDFDTYLLVQNPDDEATDVILEFMLPDGGTVQPCSFNLAGNSRHTVHLDALPDLRDAEVSTKVSSVEPVVAERSMYFRYDGKDDGSNSIGSSELGTTWYMAEGCTRPGLDTYVLLQNPNEFDVEAALSFQVTNGAAVSPLSLQMKPHTRRTIHLNDLPGLADADIATTVDATGNIVAERAMYFNYQDKWTGGHCSVGSNLKGPNWSLAEGYTGSNFDTYILVLNPGQETAVITFYFQINSGRTVEPYSFDLHACSRRTVRLNDLPGLANTNVSTTVQANKDVVVERSMYFDYESENGGSCSIGICYQSVKVGRVETTTEYGRERGYYDSNSVATFLGMRYAQPTGGANRWKPPVKPGKFAGVHDATQWGDICSQNTGQQDPSIGPKASEDCLNLNIWTPRVDAGKRPVMVWIHGGGWISGSSQEPLYNGSKFAGHGNVVFVSMNYRLGCFGFLGLGNCSQEGQENYKESGCLGLLDQVAALQWVHDNISHFGGDPDNVTLFGESAGSMSTCCLMACPKAKGLFQKAIAESGGLNTLRDVAYAGTQANQFMQSAGQSTIAVMTTLTTQQLLNAQASFLTNDFEASLRFGPVMDGVTLPENPLNAIAHGDAKDVKLLIGTNLDETRLWGLGADAILAANLTLISYFSPYVKNCAGNNAVAITNDYQSRHPELPGINIPMRICSDIFFRLPQIRVAERQALHQADTYMYLFTWPSPVKTQNGFTLDSCHGVEIGFVFDNLDAGSSRALTGDNPPKELAQIMQQTWIAFAWNGNPNNAMIPYWAPYNGGDRQTMMLDYSPGAGGKIPTLIPDPYGGDRQVWDAFPFDSYNPAVDYEGP